MYLKRLELLGFKSFADKIKLEFMPGVTAVVGPNGSGKSNISDALRWVLGEQSIKNLRGAKMDDLIFAGTELRKSLGLAEVTMVLDNSDHAMPLDFTEVSVTRKLFRSGESEYLINKSQVRLKDIHELFYDTGLGKDAYSVISQGKIDSILSVKAEERRSIFEEAAGIIRYKSRKQVAERKLEDTDKNLVRVQDIINELQSQLEPLEGQAELALQYLQMKGDLSELEINHYGKIIKVFVDELAQVQRSKAETAEKFKDFEGEANVIDSELEEIRLNLLNLDVRINELNEAYFRIQNAIDKFTEQSGFLHTKLNDLDGEETANLKSMAVNEERKSDLLAEGSNLAAEVLEVTHRLTTDQSALQTEEDSLKSFNDSLKSLETQEQNLKNELIEALNGIAGLKNKQNSTSLQKGFLTKQAEECHRKEAVLGNQRNEFVSQSSVKEADLQHLAQQIEKLQRARADLLQQIGGLQQEMVSQEEKNQEFRHRTRALDGKIGLLEDMEKSYQGYFQGVKSLLADSTGERFHSKIRGIVADLIKVKPGMELALETALGSSLQHIVIEDDQAAQDAIAFLKRKSKGRATFLPLNRVRAVESHQQNLLDILKANSCHTAVSLLEYDSQYQQVIYYLLNQVIVAPDLRAAIAVSAKLDRGFKIVTPEGDFVNPGGSITGGSNDRQRVGLLSRKRDIEDLKQEKAELELALNQGVAALKAKQQIMLDNQAKVDELRTNENETCLKKVAVERDINTLTQNLDRIIGELGIIKEQLVEFEEESIRFESGKEELGQAIDAGERQLKEIEAALENLALSNKTAKLDKELQLQKIVELKSRISAQLQELHGKEAFKTNLAKHMAELDSSSQELHLKQAEVRMKREQTQATLTELEVKITDERVRLVQQYELINGEKRSKEDMQAKMRELEGKQRSFRRRNNDFQNQLHRLELVISQKSNDIDNLRRNLVEDYGFEWENGFKEDWQAPPDVETLIDHLKTAIRELGPVNVTAIEDYRQVKQRSEFLSAQAQDLDKAKNSLKKVIAEIERTIEKRFLETFDLIRVEFRKIFSELFEGGSAELYLQDPENILESGIEIIAQPPGKKLQSLSLLSGGERAMTAIALLFAILSIRPAPFCILDEIDATLDEVNVQRFAKLLELFSKQLQFVVVTHRRGTMEAANTLYGVTMEEMGISKLISLDLGDNSIRSA